MSSLLHLIVLLLPVVILFEFQRPLELQPAPLTGIESGPCAEHAVGGRKDNGSNPNTPAMGSRHIIRTALQQLSDAGLISMKETKTVQSVDGDQKLYSGRVLTASGQKLLDEVAHSVRPAAEESYPGLAKY